MRSAEELTRARRTRALEESLDVRPRPGTLSARFEVRNPRRETRYSVFLPAFPLRDGAMCNCTDFGRRGLGTCKHIESVLLWLSEHPNEGGPAPRSFDGRGFWGLVDASVDRVVALPNLDPVRAREPGSYLFEKARAPK
ncbi:MAG: hypothetical protein L3J95_06165 [Thermoplasmata archaeon]|nr:hypothetical protein [Thermoplasmata archaeon]